MQHEQILQTLSSHSSEWHDLPIQEKVQLLDTMLANFQNLDTWNICNESLKTQLMDPQIEELDSVYEALISISVVKTQLTRLKTTLSSLVLGKAPEAKSIRNTADDLEHRKQR